jgi:ATP-dependent helicase HrpB
VLAWGGDPRALAWFDAPAPPAIDAAFALLERLGAVDVDRRLTDEGRALRRLPLHPRLARLLLTARAAPEAARACALLSERHFVPPRKSATSCDLLSAIEHERDLPPHIARVAREIRESARQVLGRDARDRIDDESFRRAVLAAYPDRVAWRRAPHGDRFLLASGSGARLSRDSGVHDADFIVAVEVTTAGARPGAAPQPTSSMPSSAADDPLIRMATRIERDWLPPTAAETRHEFDHDSGSVRALRVDLYEAVPLRERSVPPDPDEAARLVAAAYIKRGPRDEDTALMHRLAFSGIDATFESLVRQASVGVKRLDDVRVGASLPADVRRTLDRQAPDMLPVPNGRPVRLDYRGPDRVVAAVRLQGVIGLTETPRLGPKRIPVTFELLAPNGRPVQTTTDLASFWSRVYPEIRTALRARYPKHHWP